MERVNWKFLKKQNIRKELIELMPKKFLPQSDLCHTPMQVTALNSNDPTAGGSGQTDRP